MGRISGLIAIVLAPSVSWAGATPGVISTGAPALDEIGLASLAVGLVASGVLLLRVRKRRSS